MVIKHKTFEAESPADLDVAVNAFLAPLDLKNVLDFLSSAFASSKYGTNKTYVTTIVYKE